MDRYAKMGVDGNFKRLEDEVNRLLEVLEKLRQENARQVEESASLREHNATLRQENTALKDRVEALEAEGALAQGAQARLAEVEAEYQQVVDSQEAARLQVARILSRLEEVPL